MYDCVRVPVAPPPFALADNGNRTHKVIGMDSLGFIEPHSSHHPQEPGAGYKRGSFMGHDYRENRNLIGRQKATTLRVRCQVATVDGGHISSKCSIRTERWLSRR